jgi:murein DD-endopeptidase MepM/ murein hydrolase activator NlpD
VSEKPVADKASTKKPSPEAEKKVSAPKSVGNDPWSDKPFCTPLKVMEIRRRDKHGIQTPAVKSAWGWYRQIEVKKEPNSSETKLVFKNHDGVDFAAEPGSAVYNVFDGEFVSVRTSGDYGCCITISHQTKDLPTQQRAYLEALGCRTFQTFYAHLLVESDFIKNGKTQKPFFIKAGQLIAESGSSGNAIDMPNILKGAHLHFEARFSSAPKKTFDPLPLFNPVLIKDACRIYINKHLENPQKHPRFGCKKQGCDGCDVKIFKGDAEKMSGAFSINAALNLLESHSGTKN